ncbi:MAG: sigma 54-interacting transcriptional regulator [candidate division Zixibacteria bacterium]
MDNTSQHTARLSPRLLEIEGLFKQRKIRQGLSALDKLDQVEYSPEGLDLGLYSLLLAERGYYDNDYKMMLDNCRVALDELGTTSLNYRIGRLQYLVYLAYSSLGDLKAAEQAARDSLASYRRVKDDAGIIDAYNALGKIYFIRSDYGTAAEYVNEAIQYSAQDSKKTVQLLGNLGRIYLLTGDLDKAQENLEKALNLGKELELASSIVLNQLSLGYLYIRRRHFYQAGIELTAADNLIREFGFKRERVISLEYQGELCYEKQDFVAAKNHLEEAISLANELAPQSTLMSQCLRRFAETELELGHDDVAMRHVQKALNLAKEIGEKSEIGMSHRVISAIFLSRGESADARRHGSMSIDILREIGDSFELGRSIIQYGAIPPAGVSISDRKAIPLLREAEKIFTVLGDDYYVSRCRFELGRLCYHLGKNGEALEYLKLSYEGFRSIGDKAGAKTVSDFLDSLSRNAVIRALSNKNEFKLFSNLVSGSEIENIKSGRLENLLEILCRKIQADRGLIIDLSENGHPEINALYGFEEPDFETAISGFSELIEEGIISDRPILVLDGSNGAEFMDLVPTPENDIACLIVLPLTLATEVIGYIYLDRISQSPGKGINPFSQNDIDFSVGFADLVAFKTADLQKEKLLEDNLRLKAQLLETCAFPNIITQSRAFMEILARVRQVANSNMAISITGATGTGKDLLAKAIHYNSARRDKRFISVNCAALPESLLESELFGYKRGAFTGADRDKPGLFEEADGGTFFLDEIADMPLSLQAKVLRLLENMEITRLGDTHPRKVDVRVISATNKDLKKEMEQKRFRSDLYYRLCALHFSIPPLRERKEDIPLLVEHFLDGSNCQVMPDAMKYLIDYDWPGNIRELENEIKKTVLLANNEGPITSALLSRRILGEDQNNVMRIPNEEAYFTEGSFSLYDYIAEFEKRFIVKALKEQRGVKKRAADSLKIPESTLRLKLKQYDIDPKRLDIN